jgi:hypothetical protein
MSFKILYIILVSGMLAVLPYKASVLLGILEDCIDAIFDISG